MEAAVDALHAGAFDFVNKPLDLELLDGRIQRAVDAGRRREPLKRLDEGRAPSAGNLLSGQNAWVRELEELIGRVAPADTSVLITGESGTGKELVARALHALSPRAEQPFVGVNCAALPPALLEAELFGHVRGAFTDAASDRLGLFSQAAGGTLLLDEIGDMPIELQPKLLRVLQEREFRPVGGNTLTPMKARVLAATHRDLEEAVKAGKFREDLLYRLNVVQLVVPPLRARGSDIVVLARELLAHLAARAGKQLDGFTPAAEGCLLRYDWPGNVRQLENAIARAVALTTGSRVDVDDLPDQIVRYRRTIGVPGWNSSDALTLGQLEERHIALALRTAHGNKTQAAKALGIDRRTLYRKLERQTTPRPESGSIAKDGDRRAEP